MLPRIRVPPPLTVTVLPPARARSVLLPDEFRVILPAFEILVPFTVRTMPLLKPSVLPAARWRLFTDALMSRVTVLLPFVMQTLSLELFGAPAGFQSAPLLQLPFPATFQVDRVPVRVHCGKAAAEQKNTTTTAAKLGSMCPRVVC